MHCGLWVPQRELEIWTQRGLWSSTLLSPIGFHIRAPPRLDLGRPFLPCSICRRDVHGARNSTKIDDKIPIKPITIFLVDTNYTNPVCVFFFNISFLFHNMGFYRRRLPGLVKNNTRCRCVLVLFLNFGFVCISNSLNFTNYSRKTTPFLFFTDFGPKKTMGCAYIIVLNLSNNFGIFGIAFKKRQAASQGVFFD